jgi:hypothetical protein
VKGRVVSLEERERISKRMKGHKPAFSKPVILLNTGHVFQSVMQAERETGASAVSRACKKGYTAGKMPDGSRMRWKFAD